MKIILAGNINKDISQSLENMGFEIFYTVENSNLLPGLRFHPDMQIVKLGKDILCDTSVYDYYKNLKPGECNAVCAATCCKSNYPEDIAYNIKVVGDAVFHNFKYTDPLVLKYISDKVLIDVSQGYSGCSICKVSNEAIITADRKICEKSIENGIDALLINPGNIILDGFDYGFIGGASFWYDNTVCFFGSLKYHPEGNRIFEFCQKHGARIRELAEGKLSDYGSAVVID